MNKLGINLAGYYDGQLFDLKNTINVNPEYYRHLHEALRLVSLPQRKLVRVGRERDGGYVMLDDFCAGQKAYSFGINNEVSWDLDMAARGLEIFMYDHTIAGLPLENEHFHYFHRGLAGAGTADQEELWTLPELVAANGHQNEENMILKIDVEGSEWEALADLTESLLQRFAQITIELHDLVTTTEEAGMARILHCLAKLRRTHHLIHLHGNNCSLLRLQVGNHVFPDCVEATYANKSLYGRAEQISPCLPLALDCPNDHLREDVPLGWWNEPLAIL